MGHTIAWPSHWKRAALYAAMSRLVYPNVLLLTTPAADDHARAVFAVYVAVILAGASVAVYILIVRSVIGEDRALECGDGACQVGDRDSGRFARKGCAKELGVLGNRSEFIRDFLCSSPEFLRLG